MPDRQPDERERRRSRPCSPTSRSSTRPGTAARASDADGDASAEPPDATARRATHRGSGGHACTATQLPFWSSRPAWRRCSSSATRMMAKSAASTSPPRWVVPEQLLLEDADRRGRRRARSADVVHPADHCGRQRTQEQTGAEGLAADEALRRTHEHGGERRRPHRRCPTTGSTSAPRTRQTAAPRRRWRRTLGSRGRSGCGEGKA